MLGLDYAGGRPGGPAVAAAGYGFCCRYLSDGGDSLPGKLLLPDEAAGLRAAGVLIVGNWETTADRALDGFQAGVADASSAQLQVIACGGDTAAPIYFSVDFDAAPEQQDAIDSYLAGAASILGAGRVGIYGGYWPVSRALDNGSATWAWQTLAWSGGNIDSRIHLLQHVGTVTVNGVDCDVNESRQANFGAWSTAPAAATSTNSNTSSNTSSDSGGPAMTLTQADIDAITSAVTKWLSDFIIGYVGPIGSDVKDIRQELTGGRDAGQFPGRPDLGNRTVADALAAVGARNGVTGCVDPNPSAIAKS